VFRFGRSAPDAPFADEARHPLILLSHGTGGSAAQLSWLAEALATAGFIVAGVDHHGNTATEAMYRPGGFVLPGERARDLSALVSLLLQDALLGVHIDSTRIGAAGFSLGGFSVLALSGAHLPPDDWQTRCALEPETPWCTLPPEAPFTLQDIDSLARSDAAFQAARARGLQSALDPRIAAVFAMAPALVPAVDTLSLRAISVPVHVLLGDDDAQVPHETTARMFTAHVQGSHVSRLQGTSHYAFLAECTWRGRMLVRSLCASSGVDRGETHARAASEALNFFRQHLRPAD
jgi:predicted dienelactone hydrolase